MEETNKTPHEHGATPQLQPVQTSERIEAMDVVRGFALIGIFFMNIEWFNRSYHEMGNGIPSTAQAWDWWASFFVNYFVAGKFWTIFSLLFGMGFAVMLQRSEAAGRAFFKPYIRRIIALAIFGIIHTVFIWPGDILYSYAFTAAALLLVLFAPWRLIVDCAILFTVLGVISELPQIKALSKGETIHDFFESFFVLAGVTSYMLVIAWFIRGKSMVSIGGKSRPLFSVVFFILGLVLVGGGIAMRKDSDALFSFMAGAFASFLIAFLSARFHQPESSRLWRAALAIYILPFVIGTGVSLSDWGKPVRNVFDSPEAVQLAKEKDVKRIEQEKREAAGLVIEKDAKKDADKKNMSEAKKRIEKDADRINRIKEREKLTAEDNKASQQTVYAVYLKHRFIELIEGPFNPAGLAFLGIALFLLGVWFVRAGIITNIEGHLDLFRRLALFGLPLGWGLSLLSSQIASSHISGVEGDHFGLAFNLLELANLPTCLAYVSILILMLHSKTIFSKVSVFAPYGRMALTNYLSQSLIQGYVFYGWGLGHFGLGRAQQLAFAVTVIILQIIFSHLWLSQFRYGPMEWLWRAITYWKLPPMKI